MRSFSLGQSSQAGWDIPRVLSALVTEGSRGLELVLQHAPISYDTEIQRLHGITQPQNSRLICVNSELDKQLQRYWMTLVLLYSFILQNIC